MMVSKQTITCIEENKLKNVLKLHNFALYTYMLLKRIAEPLFFFPAGRREWGPIVRGAEAEDRNCTSNRQAIQDTTSGRG